MVKKKKKNPAANKETQETWARSLGWEDPLEEGMATHSSSLAWEIPWTEELGRLRSIGSQRVRHNSTHAAAIFFQFTGNLNNSSSYATSLATTVLGFLLIPSSGVSESQSGAHCALGGGKEGSQESSFMERGSL